MLKLTLVVSSIFSDLIAVEIWVRFSAGGAAVAEVAALPVVVCDLLSVAAGRLSALLLLEAPPALLSSAFMSLVSDLVVETELMLFDLSCVLWACSPFAAPAFSSAAFLFIAPDFSVPPDFSAAPDFSIVPDDFSSTAPPGFMAPPAWPTVPFSGAASLPIAPRSAAPPDGCECCVGCAPP